MKKDAKGLLNKKITELTLEDFALLDKPLGTAMAAFPMFGTQRVENDKGQTSVRNVLSHIANDQKPLHVFSERPYDEVLALAYCDMPVPSMLPLFRDALERRYAPLERRLAILEGKEPQHDIYNRTQFLIGDPGHGKSFMGALMGRLRTNAPVEIYDCGGKNMNDLLFEMVLDFGAGDALPHAIDKRIKAGTLHPLSVGWLLQLDADVETDLSEARNRGVAGEERLAEISKRRVVSLDAAGNIISIDWNAVKNGGSEKVKASFDILTKVSKIEGLDNAGGNALGMNSQYGALIRAFLENREIVLDEYNKSREGSDNALQTVLQFLNGEKSDATVDNPLKNKDNTSGPSSFTFRREDMGAGFFVTFTGNKKEDGITTRALNKSVYDRLQPDTLPDPEVIDWQHRICQLMVGVPVSTLYTVFKESADANPDAFGEWLLKLRRDKAKIEGVPVPELQETLLANWKNVVSASYKLAFFYDKWAEMTTEETLTMTGNGDLIDEVDTEYSNKDGMSFRRIKQHLDQALPLRAQMEPWNASAPLNFSAFGQMPKAAEKIEENPALHFGTRLVNYIESLIYQKSGAVGKKKLYAKLMSAMENNECALRQISLQEGALSGQKSVEDLLNISAFADRNINRQALLARKVFCDYLRHTDPAITAEDEQIVTLKKFVDALTHVSETDTASAMSLYIANRDHAEVYAGKPLELAVVRDMAVNELNGLDLDVQPSDLVEHDDFMASLALPTVSGKNLSAIWEKNLAPLLERKDGATPAAMDVPPAAAAPGSQAPKANDTPDNLASLQITENNSPLNLGFTTLSLGHKRADGKFGPVLVHILHHSQRNKTLIVGENVPSKLKAAFNEAGIIHVDRNDPMAKNKVETALNDLTRSMPPSVRQRLSEAFSFRNDVAISEDAGMKQKLPPIADLLVDPTIEAHLPKFVVKMKKAA